LKEMKRAAVLALLFAAFSSCAYYKPVMTGDRGRMQPCREIGRSRCAADTCRGAHMDYVTLSCGGRTLNRCVANTGCSAQ
jgi:hypothetical protein